jgi:UDP-glucose 4-epimerase
VIRNLLTGGAGDNGSTCLRWLVRRRHETIACESLLEGNREAVLPWCPTVDDTTEVDTLASTVRAHRIEAVIQFAAVHDSISNPEGYYRINTLGTTNVLDAMRQADVPRNVFSSTAATPGYRPEMPLIATNFTAALADPGTARLRPSRPQRPGRSNALPGTGSDGVL